MTKPVAAVSIAVLRGQDVLLVQRGQEPMLGTWSLPGGRIELGETAAAGALRELAEETGVTADIVGICDIVDVIRHDAEGALSQHFVILVYAAQWRAGEPVAASDSADACFVPVDTVPALNHTPDLPRVITRACSVVATGRTRS